MITARLVNKQLVSGRILITIELTRGDESWTETIVIENAASAKNADVFITNTVRLLIEQRSAVLDAFDGIVVDPDHDLVVPPLPIDTETELLSRQFGQYRFLQSVFGVDASNALIDPLRVIIEAAIEEGRIDFLGVHPKV